ncbi:hypothetical protein C1645_817527 [Glomus cerebriforme]|uniref:Uncharacterized protein n=1 Tax=Glomus cerebriforme TaxID=658196 RepID=A0A397T9A8_9GLOM|nr:hypothetical protein C1645_817527 [Glomus cerebriforme]
MYFRKVPSYHKYALHSPFYVSNNKKKQNENVFNTNSVSDIINTLSPSFSGTPTITGTDTPICNKQVIDALNADLINNIPIITTRQSNTLLDEYSITSTPRDPILDNVDPHTVDNHMVTLIQGIVKLNPLNLTSSTADIENELLPSAKIIHDTHQPTPMDTSSTNDSLIKKANKKKKKKDKQDSD